MTTKVKTGNSRLKFSEFKLSTLLEITNAINNNLPAKELFVLFKYILEHQLNIGKSVLFLLQDDEWITVLNYGVSDDELNTDVEKDLRHINDITVVAMESNDNTASFDVVIPVFHQSEIIAYLLLGDLDEQELKASPIIKHLPFIQTLGNITAVAVENQRLIRKSLEQERLRQELETAREMQSLLFPKALPNDDCVQIDAVYLPHQQVGGDYYDVIEIDDDVFICLADVSGKGISAAIVMANFQANLRAILRVEKDLKRIIHELNTRVWNNANGEKFITMFLARYSKSAKALDFINAAHPAPILVQENHVFTMKEGCIGLGMFEEIPFVNQGEFKIKPGCILTCYTDGISEMENEKGEVFEEEDLIRVIRQNQQKEMKDLNHIILKSLTRFGGKNGFHDDVALVSSRFF